MNRTDSTPAPIPDLLIYCIGHTPGVIAGEMTITDEALTIRHYTGERDGDDNSILFDHPPIALPADLAHRIKAAFTLKDGSA